MRDHLDICALANWVSMLRADIDGAILLADDEDEGRFYEKCKHERARVVPSPGVALNLLKITEGRGVSGLIATIRCFEDSKSPRESVFHPELGDVASLLLTSTCLDATLEEIAGVNWVKAYVKEVGALADRVVANAWIFEHLRSTGFNSSPEDLVSKYVDWNVFYPAISVIEAEAGLDVADVVKAKVLEAKGSSTKELLRECDGLLAVEMLAGATRHFRPRGLASDRAVSASEIMGMLRVAFNLCELEKDQMFWRMRRWERRNVSFPLLRQWRILDPLQVVLDQRYWESDLKTMLDNDPLEEGLSAFKMDLDNFKAVNEQLGHSGGDEAIRLACSTLRDCVCNIAEVYRRGGDELVALAPGLRGKQAQNVAESIRSKIESAMLSWGSKKNLSTNPTASIGLGSVDVLPIR